MAYKNYKSHVRSDKRKWILTGIAFLLVAVILMGLITAGFKDFNPYCWFGHSYNEETTLCDKCGKEQPVEVVPDEQPAEEQKPAEGTDEVPVTPNEGTDEVPATPNEGGNEVNPDETTPVEGDQIETPEGAMRLSSRRVDPAQFVAEGIDPQADSAYVVTATVLPANATDKRLDWSVAFELPDSTWATGKDVANYVEVFPTEDGALTAQLVCYKAFSIPITLTVRSRLNPETSATVELFYAAKIDYINSDIASGSYCWGGDCIDFSRPSADIVLDAPQSPQEWLEGRFLDYRALSYMYVASETDYTLEQRFIFEKFELCSDETFSGKVFGVYMDEDVSDENSILSICATLWGIKFNSDQQFLDAEDLAKAKEAFETNELYLRVTYSYEYSPGLYTKVIKLNVDASNLIVKVDNVTVAYTNITF